MSRRRSRVGGEGTELKGHELGDGRKGEKEGEGGEGEGGGGGWGEGEDIKLYSHLVQT